MSRLSLVLTGYCPQVSGSVGCFGALSKVRIYRQVVSNRIFPPVVVALVVRKMFSVNGKEKKKLLFYMCISLRLISFIQTSDIFFPSNSTLRFIYCQSNKTCDLDRLCRCKVSERESNMRLLGYELSSLSDQTILSRCSKFSNFFRYMQLCRHTQL